MLADRSLGHPARDLQHGHRSRPGNCSEEPGRAGPCQGCAAMASVPDTEQGSFRLVSENLQAPEIALGKRYPRGGLRAPTGTSRAQRLACSAAVASCSPTGAGSARLSSAPEPSPSPGTASARATGQSQEHAEHHAAGQDGDRRPLLHGSARRGSGRLPSPDLRHPQPSAPSAAWSGLPQSRAHRSSRPQARALPSSLGFISVLLCLDMKSCAEVIGELEVSQHSKPQPKNVTN